MVVAPIRPGNTHTFIHLECQKVRLSGAVNDVIMRQSISLRVAGTYLQVLLVHNLLEQGLVSLELVLALLILHAHLHLLLLLGLLGSVILLFLGDSHLVLLLSLDELDALSLTSILELVLDGILGLLLLHELAEDTDGRVRLLELDSSGAREQSSNDSE